MQLPGMLEDVRKHRRIYALAMCANMVAVFFGWDTGLIGGVLGMESFQLSFGLTELSSTALASVQGNIVSTLQGGCFFGAAASAYLSDRFGRYPSLYIATIIFLIGSIIQTTSGLNSSSLAQIYVGRFIGGFGVGLSSAVVPSYVSESAPPEVRGRCTGAMQLLNVTGIMVSYWANYGLSLNITPATNPAMWRIAFGLQMIPGVSFLLLMLPFRESPRWLIEKGRIDEARKIMAYYRQVPVDDPQLELTMREIVEDVRGKEKLPMRALFKMSIENRTIFYRCWIGIILMFWQQWCGTNSINYYSPEIFEALGLSGANAGLFATGVYGIVKVVCTATGLMLCTEQLGRKRCMIYFGLVQAVAMFFIGAYMKIHPSGPPVPASYAAIVMVYIYVVGYSFGWGTIPWVVAAEAVPNHLRTLSMSGALMTQWLFNFVIAQITPTMLATIKYGTFFVFGSCCVAMVLTAYLGVPETKGIPLEEIHAVFEGNILKRSIADAPGGPVICRALGWGVQRSPAVAPAGEARSDGSSTTDADKEKREEVKVENVV